MKDGVIAEEGTIDEVIAKYRSQSAHITVRLADTGGEAAQNVSAMRMLPSVNSSDYNERSGAVTLGAVDSERAEALYDELITLIAEKKIKISELISQKTTLEDVYFAITGLGGRA
jgi:ABC-type multidrug transport system ATPase subunit